MSDIESTTNKRPKSITAICVIGFIGAIITIPMIFSPIAKQIGAWYPLYLGLSAVIGLVCMIGLMICYVIKE